MMDRVVIPPIDSTEGTPGVRFVGRSDVGRTRTENQDFMGVFRARDRVLAVVADGMGGASGGYEASRIAVDAMRHAFVEGNDDDAPKVLADGVRLGHARIREVTATSPALEGMGTTLVAALFVGQRAWLVHVGDSRAYLVRDGAATLLTLDHSRVHRMLLEGMIRADQLADHPMGHILERSVGASEALEPEVRAEPVELQRGDRLLLCSDGVWSVVAETAVGTLASVDDLALAAEGVLGVALAHGTDDNATVVVVQAVDAPDSAPRPKDARALAGIPTPVRQFTRRELAPPTGDSAHAGQRGVRGPIAATLCLLVILACLVMGALVDRFFVRWAAPDDGVGDHGRAAQSGTQPEQLPAPAAKDPSP